VALAVIIFDTAGSRSRVRVLPLHARLPLIIMAPIANTVGSALLAFRTAVVPAFPCRSGHRSTPEAGPGRPLGC
jgi:hypothetical protein